MLEPKQKTLRKHRLRRGATIVEFTVVVAIVVLLLVLLIPAVQRARESARRTQCKNNMKQLGLALLNYHDIYQMFPAGHHYTGIFDGDPNSGRGGSAFSWGWAILPFVDSAGLFPQFCWEQQAAENRVDTQGNLLPGNGYTNAALCATVNPSFSCPSDAKPGTRADGAISHSATSSYQGNAGSYNGYHNGGTYDPEIEMYRRNGVLGRNNVGGPISLDDVTDGVANTILVAETKWNMQTDGMNRSRWYGAQEKNGFTGAQGATNSLCVQGEWPMNWTEPQGNPQPNRTAGSAHPGGAHFLFCDGSVKFVSENIQHSASAWIDVEGRFDLHRNGTTYGLYQRLFSRNDGLKMEIY